ncbi:MAG: hypothetical protein LBV19_04245 [Streptococcaceae bacterium]|jgi:hypothetical protein|nr:hypothetical protein [Streptococcaceae bacterium]
MSVLLALIAGIGSLANIYFLGEIIWLQWILTLLAWFALLTYRGRKSVKSYTGDGTRLMTIRFAICFLAVLGSTLILFAKLIGWN